MSRVAFYNALANDVYLNSLGIKDDSENPTLANNYSREERLSSETPFIILRWGSQLRPRNQDPDVVVKSPESVTLWVHWPQEKSEDFGDLNKILDQVDSIVRGLRDVAGSDGYTLSFVQIGDRSDDLEDKGFHTITKTAVYEVYSRLSPVEPEEPEEP